MINHGLVQSTIKPKETEIEVTDENGSHTEYEYDQTQYSKDEYILLLSEKNKNLENMLTDTQLALCDVYEMMEG